MRMVLLFLLLLEVGFAKKLALVIGNSDYKYMEYLSSPKADARAIKDKLKTLGFTVTLEYDLDEANMMATIKRFQSELSHGDIGFFYYSGHGGQFNNESFLIPTSVNSTDSNSIRYHAVKVEEILSRMSSVGTALNLLVLDACRDDTPIGSKGAGNKGLGQVINKPTGSLILYSTGMGKTAKDSRLFNQIVLEKLGSSKYILNVVNDISREVYKQSGYKQKPEVLSSLVPDVKLGGENSGGSCSKVVRVPGTYTKVKERILTTKSYRIYKWTENDVEKTLKPKFSKVKKIVLASEASFRLKVDENNEVKKMLIPATYKRVTVNKIIEDVDLNDIPKYANYRAMIVPATYNVVTKIVVVTPETTKTISVPCSEVN